MRSMSSVPGNSMSTSSPENKSALTMQAIREAHVRIRSMIHRTPVMTSSVLDELSGNQLFFKCENLQKVGAFKARGATNAVFLLTDEEAAKGVVTHSSGNHAAALARAARLRGIPAYIVMPSNSPQAKQAAVRRYGGEILLCEPTLAARESTARQVMERTGAAFIHPYDDLRVMAGQGTTAIELLEDIPELDMILCPVGGGGQISGIAVAAKDIKPSVRIVGVEPAGADDAARSLAAGQIIPMLEPRTIADGLKTSLGVRPFAEMSRWVDHIVTVEEESIVQSMRQIWEVMKLIVEPSGAVSNAAIVEKKIPASSAKIGIILSGGNLDLGRLPWQL
jgi:threonine dehydratase